MESEIFKFADIKEVKYQILWSFCHGGDAQLFWSCGHHYAALRE